MPLHELVSPFVGVVRAVEDVLAAPDDLSLVNVFCETGYLAGLRHVGGGSGETREAARAAAVGEAVERYSACVAPEATTFATAAELGPAAVEPGRFALFHERQHAEPGFPYARFTPETRIAWVEGRALPGGAPAYLPAQLVYLGWLRPPGEAPIARATSNGLACRDDAGAATLTGLLELLERDAFLLTWGARISWPRLSWRGGPLAEFERRRLAPTGLRCEAIDLSPVWDVPCVLGVVRSDAAGTAPVGVGAAAAQTVERAVVKALDEAVRVRSWARTIGVAGGEPPAESEIRDFDDHIRFYSTGANVDRTRFLDASTETRDVRDVQPLEGGVDAVCDRLAARGTSAYAVDVTSADVRDAGLHVVRVVAPELCALDVEHGARFLGGRRRYEEPFRLGLRDRPLHFDDLNPDPHPFP